MPLRFGDFVFDAECVQLLRNGAPVHLSPKAFRLLEVLIAHRPAVVSKQQLLDDVWEGQIVEEENIKNLIAEVRKAMGDNAIRTAHRRGYAFVADAGVTGRRSAASWFLTDGVDVHPIRGSAVIGRGAEADIRVRSGSVSRLHARIVAGPAGVTIEDLGSKNGTVVGGARIAHPTPVFNGDIITLGSVSLTLQNEAEQTTTLPPA
ncbi:MAG TPA: FHA domain-containing protein [Thermoanaerobaculia bacterium]|jgi:DNA-binding winged helix-turn-helix (wHTH) protein|nr:FHA domain-containing protein [Thermoanaerobaculia bacterium]